MERHRAVLPDIPTVAPLRIRPKEPPLDANGRRRDARETGQLRPIFMKTGVISQASGSAYVEMHNTKVICGVYGPRQTVKTQYSDRGKLNCSFKFATFAYEHQRKGYLRDDEEREYSQRMEQALEVSVILDKLPKSMVDVFALVIQADGAALSAAIVCASLALADAAIEMYDLVASCTACQIGPDIFLDPTHAEEQTAYASGGAHLVLAGLPNIGEITQVLQSGGELEPSVVQDTFQRCWDRCLDISGLMAQHLVDATAKKLAASATPQSPPPTHEENAAKMQ